MTGSHFFKTGLQVDEGIWNTGTGIDRKVGFGGERIVGNISYRFLDGRPNGLTQYATPNLQQNTLKADLGIFAQDQWTIRRLTLNASSLLGINTAYGAQWRFPVTSLATGAGGLDGRLVEFSGQLTL